MEKKFYEVYEMLKLMPRIGELIDKQGRRRPWVANQLGVSRASLANWEKAEAMIPYDKARLLAKVLGVTMEELYEEVEE